MLNHHSHEWALYEDHLPDIGQRIYALIDDSVIYDSDPHKEDGYIPWVAVLERVPGLGHRYRFVFFNPETDEEFFNWDRMGNIVAWRPYYEINDMTNTTCCPSHH